MISSEKMRGKPKYTSGKKFLILIYEISKMIWFYICLMPMIILTGYSYWIEKKQIVKNVKYGDKQRNLLDIYPSSEQNENNDEQQQKKKKIVVIFLHGGGWGSGDKMHYALLGRRMQENGITLIVPNYTLYPQGKVESMLEDLAMVFQYVQANYPGTFVCFIGHSAGAHLGALYMLNHALYTVLGQDLPDVFDETRHNMFKFQLNLFIGLSGPYDIEEHWEHESWRGVEHISAMEPAMHKHENFAIHSPTKLVSQMSSLTRTRRKGVGLAPILLWHSENDTTVPWKSSKDFFYALQTELNSYVVPEVSFRLLRDMSHSDAVFLLMETWRAQHKAHLAAVIDTIKQRSLRQQN